MNYFDVEELLVDIIKKYPEVESAEAQFLSLLEADEELKENFTEWCMSKGYNERKAFLIFIRIIFLAKIRFGTAYSRIKKNMTAINSRVMSFYTLKS